jgi:hypothetical protein
MKPDAASSARASYRPLAPKTHTGSISLAGRQPGVPKNVPTDLPWHLQAISQPGAGAPQPDDRSSFRPPHALPPCRPINFRMVWRKWTAATRVKKSKPRTAGVSASQHARAVAGPCCQSWKRSCSRTYCCARGGECMSPPPDHPGRHELTSGGACYRMNERPGVPVRTTRQG